MSKITIIEGNSDDKDQVRNFMVKGERGDDGVSPTFETSKEGDTATITIHDVEGTHEVELKDGVSPTITSSKTGSTTTLTITDAEGTHTATILDGETANIIDSTTLSDNTTETYSGRIVDEKLATKFSSGNIVVIDTNITLPANEREVDKLVNFPTGFNRNNCVILSVMESSRNPETATNPYWINNYDDMYIDSSTLVPGLQVSLSSTFYPQEDKIVITRSVANAPSSDSTRYIRIVLMKIAS